MFEQFYQQQMAPVEEKIETSKPQAKAAKEKSA